MGDLRQMETLGRPENSKVRVPIQRLPCRSPYPSYTPHSGSLETLINNASEAGDLLDGSINQPTSIYGEHLIFTQPVLARADGVMM